MPKQTRSRFAAANNRHIQLTCIWKTDIILERNSMRFATFLIIILLAIVANAQPKIFTDAEREQATKDFIKGYTEQNIAKGLELRNQQQYIAAITVYTKALLVDPHNTDALVNRAVTYYLAGQYFRASKDLAIAVQYNPEHYGANFQHGFVLLKLGFADDALPYLQKAKSLTTTPSKLVSYYAMQAEMFTGNYRQCVENYDVFFKITNAENKNAYYSDALLPDAVRIAAYCHLGLGNRVEAQNIIKQSSSPSFNYFNYWHANMVNVADMSCRGDANESAEKATNLFRKAKESYANKKPEKNWNKQYLETFIEIQNGLICDPNNISLLQTRTEFSATEQPAHYYRVYYRQLQKQLEKTNNPNANQILANLSSKSLLMDDPRYFGMYTIKKEYESNGKFVGGDLVNLDALDEKFTNADLAIKAAEKLFEDYLPRQDTTTRLLYLNAALELEPNNAEALALRARTFFNSQSQYLQPLAWRDATAALKINPKLVSPYTVRGAILRGENNLSAALIEINKGLAINPNDPKALVNRGLTEISLGNKDAGFRDLNRIIEIAPENGAYYAVRAGAYNTDGQTAKAISDYQKASKLSPPYGTRDQNSDIELIKLYDKTGEKALADALHKQYYEKFRSSIINNLITNYETIANRNPAIGAQIEGNLKDYYKNEEAKREAERKTAAIAEYDRTVDECNRIMGYYNSKVEQGNRQTDRVAQDLVVTWNGYKTAKAVADMKALLGNLLRDHGSYLPPAMKDQVEAQLKSLK